MAAKREPDLEALRRTGVYALGQALAKAAKWEGCLDVDAVVEDLCARGWRLTEIPPDHPDHPSKQRVRDGEG